MRRLQLLLGSLALLVACDGESPTDVDAGGRDAGVLPRMDAGGAGMDARTIADSMAALTDGLWLNCLMSPTEWGRRRARETTFAMLKSLFPEELAGRLQD